jgi:hypothetical protein
MISAILPWNRESDVVSKKERPIAPPVAVVSADVFDATFDTTPLTQSWCPRAGPNRALTMASDGSVTVDVPPLE